MKTKPGIGIFLTLSFLHYIAANLAHPVTPTLIISLNLPTYMFGAAFAAMAFTNFLFSPFWGKMKEYCSAKRALLICGIGYAFGQFLFSITKTEVTILAARCVSGLFVGGISVSILIYIIDTSKPSEVGENLTKFAIVQAVGAATGFFIGGLIGGQSIRFTFLLQSLLLIVCGILCEVFLVENRVERHPLVKAGVFMREINPLKAFLDFRTFMTRNFAFLFLAVAFANIGTNAFDQCFNYYLKDQFGFTPVYNGIMKAVTGIITLLVNSTLCLWIIRHARVKRVTGLILGGCAVSIAVMLTADHIVLFFGLCTVFYAFNAVYIPLIQDLAAKGASAGNSNAVMGFYNAMKSFGMICGALIAGFIYNYGSNLPFIFAGVCFLAAAVILLARE